MSPPMNPAIGITIIAPTPKITPNPVKFTSAVVGIIDIIEVQDMAIMMPAISPIIAEIAPFIKANGTAGIFLIVFASIKAHPKA